MKATLSPKYILSIVLLTLFFNSSAQNQGDEDKDMFNKAAKRDQIAIEEAKNGWWKSSMSNKAERISWWKEGSFGMFIHWGIYSMAGGAWEGQSFGGYAEHLMRIKKIPRAKYLAFAKAFNPESFNAETWVKYARNAGMSYLIITAKHHDGFAIYPTAISKEYSISSTGFKRDPLQELSIACKKFGVKFGFYYSHAFDWEDPNAPGNDWDYHNPGGDQLIGGREWYDSHPEWLPKAKKYVNEKSIPQITELINRYHPDILWFDTPHKLPLSENLRILKAIRAIDNKVVVNGRLAGMNNFNFGDYFNTADKPAEFYPFNGDWEAIPTTNESYGYSKADSSHKSASFLIRLLAKSRAKGGNLLLNIGPMGNGMFDPRDVRILDSISIWMKKYASSIIGTSASALPIQNWGVTTLKNDSLFLHVFQPPADGKLLIAGLRSSVKEAKMMSGKSIKIIKQDEDGLWLALDKQKYDPTDEVIILKLTSPIKTDSIRRLVSSNPNNRLLAFDGVLHGGGFKFGDGKRTQYFVGNWTKKEQYISWPLKQMGSSKYKISIKYLTAANSGGSYRVKIGDFDQTFKVDEVNNRKLHELGNVTLNQGVYELTVKALNITGEELMKLYEVVLEPIE
jgi:alpha-L-fucosidase